MPDRDLEQQRAAFAYDNVKRYGDRRDRQKYATHLRSTPSIVLQNGLGQALAFLLADAEGKPVPSQDLYNALQDWLCGARVAGRPERLYQNGPLIECVIQGSRTEYQQAQQSALALLAWMRKFADAYLPKGER